jgi:hypothetical protein
MNFVTEKIDITITDFIRNIIYTILKTEMDVIKFNEFVLTGITDMSPPSFPI